MNQLRNQLKLWITPENLWWAILLAFGFIVRIRQYLSGRSLYSDEASLALNLVRRSFSGLLQPLERHQAAPVGFLFIEKSFITLFGNHDYILQLFPLLMGLLSVYLVYLIARESFGKLGMVTVLFFIGNTWLISFSTTVKQYGTDVTLTLLLIYLALRYLSENQERDLQWLALAGSVAVWMSHTSVFILAAIGITLAVEKIIFRREYKSIRKLLLMGSLWVASFGVHYFAILQYTAADDYFNTYWQRAFLPLPPWGNLHWYLKTYYAFLLILLGRTDSILFYLFPALSFLGILSLLNRKRELGLIVILVFLVTFIASAWEKYPLVYRFMIFLIPLALFMVNEALGRIYSFITRWNRPAAFVLSAAPLAILLWYSMPFAFGALIAPQYVSEIKPVMEHVSENRQPGDIIYVYFGSVGTFQYYAPFYNLESGNIIFADNQPTKKMGIKQFYKDLDSLAGNDRVWFVFSNIIDCNGCEGDPRDFFVDSLNEYGALLDSVEAPAAGSYLYDLNP